ncbi:hypothetical protein [Lactobacillus intestinalis]|uniref:hypothetical protein n=1 Tax=Lactobacillus intestinalis TaxID=151781 RepID=UPI001F55EC98|nr:hypothetical protein [Lactobacillus intestinalis]
MKNSIRSLIKKSYGIFTSKIKIGGKNNLIKKDPELFIRNTKISIYGNNNKLIFKRNCDINGLRILILGDNNIIEFGENVVVNASNLQPTIINAVGGKKIKIGNNSMLSNNIEIHTSDYHGIYDFQGKRINYDQDVIIGNSVWIGLDTKILKGTVIPDGCIVGAGALLAGKEYNEKNCILVGVPAKILKRQIFWTKSRKEKIEVSKI